MNHEPDAVGLRRLAWLGIAVIGAGLVLGLGAAIGHFTKPPGRAAAQAPACPDAEGRCTCTEPCNDCCCRGHRDEIHATRIVLSHPKAARGDRLVLAAQPDGCGLWMEKDGMRGPLLAIFNLKDQNGVGLYGPGQKSAMAIALTVGEDGEAAIQMKDAKGGIRWLRPADVDRLQGKQPGPRKEPVGDADPPKKD